MGIFFLDKKFESFGWNVIVCEDGNDFDKIYEVFLKVDEVKDKLSVIIVKIVKGKGVSFMENNVGWYG